MPKVKGLIWRKFDCLQKATNTGKWARCKQCRIEMQGIPCRMEKHLLTCKKTKKAAENKSDETMMVVLENENIDGSSKQGN